jgi:pilus assembly protein FimV
VASLDDLDATGEMPSLDDPAEVTGKNPEVDPDATGFQVALGNDDTGINEAIDPDSTFSGSGVDTSLLDATGSTQVLPEDFAVSTMSDIERQLSDADATMLAPGYGDEETEVSIGDDQATMLASLDDDDNTDFDFAKTEALPPSAFTGNSSLDETGELPAIATTDFDLDLDDLTAALQVSEIGDTIEQVRDDATVEQRRPGVGGDNDDASPTMALDADDMSDDLHDARTMTEVGTKLDLARAYVDMGDPSGARSILEEVLDEGDAGQRQQAQQLLDSLPS